MDKIQRIAFIGGTHGNEHSGIEFVRQSKHVNIPPDSELSIEYLLANERAVDKNVRFVEADLNRQFTRDNLNAETANYEQGLAKALNQQLGPKGSSEVDLIIDIHNTTSNMGATLIVLELDEFNVQLARYVKYHMPEANILVEDEKPFNDHPYLCTLSKRGVMIEVGAQAHGTCRHNIFNLAKQMAELILAFCVHYNEKRTGTLPACEAFRFEEMIYYPLDEAGQRRGIIHQRLQDSDFKPLRPDEPVFSCFNGTDILWQGERETYPHFINEAAYHHSNVAFSTASKFLL